MTKNKDKKSYKINIGSLKLTSKLKMSCVNLVDKT